MTDPNFSAIRARLRYETLDEFIDGYSRFVSTGGMFIPMAPSKLKPVGTTIRFQFLLNDGSTAMLGEGVVRQIQGADSDDNSPVGMLVKFSRLHRETKAIVDQIVARKSQAAGDTLAPDSDELHESANLAGPETQQEPQSATQQEADGDYVEADVPAASDALTRDPHRQDTAEFQLNNEDEDSQADEGYDDEHHEAQQEEADDLGLDDMFLMPDDDDPDETADEGPFEPAPPAHESEAEELVDEEPEEFVSSGSDVFSEANAAQELEESQPEQPAAAGPKELGRTEAGLQIMAFDDVSDDEMADFADFEFGGDEDDVDQMFDGIFGGGGGDEGGGLFGGGDDGGDFFGGGDEAGEFADAGPEGLVGDSINDGGSPVAEEVAEQEPVEETYDLQDEVELEGEVELEDEVELEEQEYEEDVELEEDVEFEEEEHEEELGLDEEIDEEEFELDEEEFELDEEEFELDEEEIELDEEELQLEDEPVEELIELDEEEEQFAPEGLGEESSAPSAELMSALGSLESDANDDMSLSLGASPDAAPEVEAEPEEAEPEEEDDESLEALLAKAQQDIDAKRESDEKDEQADILDELLGGDDLPPPPKNDPVFDINDGSEKKKKGGFISKLFGKD